MITLGLEIKKVDKWLKIFSKKKMVKMSTHEQTYSISTLAFL